MEKAVYPTIVYFLHRPAAIRTNWPKPPWVRLKLFLLCHRHYFHIFHRHYCHYICSLISSMVTDAFLLSRGLPGIEKSRNFKIFVEVFLSEKELCCLCENKCVSNLLPSHLFSPKGGLGRAQAFSNFNIPNFGQFFRNQSRQWKQIICCSPPICSRDIIAQTQSLSISKCNFKIGTDW